MRTPGLGIKDFLEDVKEWAWERSQMPPWAPQLMVRRAGLGWAGGGGTSQERRQIPKMGALCRRWGQPRCQTPMAGLALWGQWPLPVGW